MAGGNAFSFIERQIALPFHKLLKLQEGLELHNGPKWQWDCGPMIWLIMYSGDSWRIGVGYVDKSKRIPAYVSLIILPL